MHLKMKVTWYIISLVVFRTPRLLFFASFASNTQYCHCSISIMQLWLLSFSETVYGQIITPPLTFFKTLIKIHFHLLSLLFFYTIKFFAESGSSIVCLSACSLNYTTATFFSENLCIGTAAVDNQ